jgi:hypothetical protein
MFISGLTQKNRLTFATSGGWSRNVCEPRPPTSLGTGRPYLWPARRLTAALPRDAAKTLLPNSGGPAAAQPRCSPTLLEEHFEIFLLGDGLTAHLLGTAGPNSQGPAAELAFGVWTSRCKSQVPPRTKGGLIRSSRLGS